MKQSMISVIMISYNHQDFIEESIISAVEQQRDTYDLEILIIDDGSSDKTQNIIRDIQNKYPNLIFPTFKKHEGIKSINKNFNEQIKKARGNYIAFLAGDDKFTHNGFKKQLDILEKEKDVELIISEGRMHYVDKQKFLDTCQEKVIVKKILNNDMNGVYEYIVSNVPRLLIQGYLLKKDLLVNINYFDEDVIADDWVLNIKIFKYLVRNKKRAVYLSEHAFQYNIHSSNTNANIKHQGTRVIQVIKKYGKDKRTFLANQYLYYCIASFKRKYGIDFFKYLFLLLPLSFYTVPILIKKIRNKVTSQ